MLAPAGEQSGGTRPPRAKPRPPREGVFSGSALGGFSGSAPAFSLPGTDGPLPSAPAAFGSQLQPQGLQQPPPPPPPQPGMGGFGAAPSAAAQYSGPPGFFQQQQAQQQAQAQQQQQAAAGVAAANNLGSSI